MDLDTIKASLNATLCCVCKVLCDTLNFFDGHWSWRNSCVRGSIHTIALEWNIRGTQWAVPIKERRHSGSTNMPDLADDEASFGMNSIGHPFPACTLL
jgi:hypothetical protein